MAIVILIVVILYALLCVATGRFNNILNKTTNRNSWNNNARMHEVESRNAYSRYILSFLVPLVGFILGSILMAKDDYDEQSMGRTCVGLGILSTFVIGIVIGILVSL